MIKFVFLFIVSLFIFTQTVEAKILPQAKGKTVVVSTGTGIGIYPKLRADRKALIINFTNLKNASQVSYSLFYQTSIQDEGAMGGLNLNGSSGQTSELLFGTCSKNVCSYHRGIKNARLEVSYTTQSGKKYLKKYKIRV